MSKGIESFDFTFFINRALNTKKSFLKEYHKVQYKSYDLYTPIHAIQCKLEHILIVDISLHL